MTYGLPTRGQADWDDELNNSIENLRGKTDAAAADASNAVSTANSATNLALAADQRSRRLAAAPLDPMLGEPFGAAELDGDGRLPEGQVPDRLTEPSLDAAIGARTISAADALPNESPFWWNTEPQSINGRVYASTTGDNSDVYLQEWTQPGGTGAPLWVRRYLLGYAGNTDKMDDHLAGSFAIAAGKPLVAFWSGHAFDNVVYYRSTVKNIDAYTAAEELTFGPVRRFEIPADQTTSYTEVMVHGNDIYLLHRTGLHDRWTLTKFPAWATGTPVPVVLLSSVDQFYAKGRIVGDTLRICVSDHPTISTDNKVWYCQVNLLTGSVTTAGGAVLGNLDGTNLPLAQASLELIFTATGTEKPWTFDMGYGPNPEIAFTSGEVPPNFAATADYMYATYVGGAWVVNPITPVGSFLGGAYFPSIVFTPDTPGSVILARDTGDNVDRVERFTTVDNGASWASALLDSSFGGAPTLTRAFGVRPMDAITPIFDVMATEIDRYPTYTDWESRFRPLPRAAKIRRLPDRSDFAVGDPDAGQYLPGTSGVYIEGANLAVPSGSVRLEVDVALDNWASGAFQNLIAKEASDTQRSVRLAVASTGKLALYWSTDGSATSVLTSTDPLGFANGQRAEVAVVFTPVHDPTHYRITFLKRMPGEERWTQIEAVSPPASNTSIFASSSPWEIGGRWAGTTELAAGTFYRASVLTRGGQVVTEWRGGHNSTTFKDAAARSWKIIGAVTAAKPTYTSAWNGADPFKLGGFTEFYDAAKVRRSKEGTPGDATDGIPTHTVRAVTTLTGSGSILTRDDVVVINATSAITATLPSASVAGAGKTYTVKCVSASGGNIGTTSAQTIDGAAAPLAIVQWESVRLLSNGSNWLKV